jgi:hypothetical protein
LLNAYAINKHMARLPDPGGDVGIWGTVLNAFLQVSLNDDGTIKDTALSSKLDTAQKGQPNGVASLNGSGKLPDDQLPAVALTTALLSQKGALIAASDAQTPATLDAGTDGQVLIASSTEPTGLAWQTPSASNGNELAWNGSDYVPTSLKTDISKPRTFKGPVDPHAVQGVTMNPNDWFDTWIGGV